MILISVKTEQKKKKKIEQNLTFLLLFFGFVFFYFLTKSDLFIVGLRDEESATRKLKEVYDSICSAIGRKALVIRTLVISFIYLQYYFCKYSFCKPPPPNFDLLI